MRLMHTMLRVNDLDQSLRFYCELLGMKLLRKQDYPGGRFTLAFVGYGEIADSSVVELTYNWDQHEYQLGDAYGHLALGVADIYGVCEQLKRNGVKVVREPGPMRHSNSSGGGGSVIAFIEDPNGYRIELIEEARQSAH
jgi:lactoylglutathione lyase